MRESGPIVAGPDGDSLRGALALKEIAKGADTGATLSGGNSTFTAMRVAAA
jgi:hypothetical protein